jgi:hypothetical protein
VGIDQPFPGDLAGARVLQSVIFAYIYDAVISWTEALLGEQNSQVRSGKEENTVRFARFEHVLRSSYYTYLSIQPELDGTIQNWLNAFY